MPTAGFTVGPEESGERLDRLSARRLDLSRSIVQHLIKEGALLVHDRQKPASYRVGEGDEIQARLPVTELLPEEILVPVVYEDEHLIVIDKPTGLVVHPGAGNRTGTLVNALLDRGLAGGEDPSRPGVVHRLDRDTSGLMVLTKSELAYSELVKALSERKIRRIYRTVVFGTGLPPTGTVDSPVGRDPENPTIMAAGIGKPAITHFERLEESDGYTVLRVRLETGRTHQIRVHLSAIGHPVYADPLYGEPVPDRRLWLHAERLAFRHPIMDELMKFEAPVPEDLREAATSLGL